MLTGYPLVRVFVLLWSSLTACFRIHTDVFACSNIHFVFWLICLPFFTSCQSGLSKDDYVAWIKDYDNGLHVKRTYSEFVFDLQYQPPAYIWLQRQNVPFQKLDTSEIASLSRIQHYILTVELTDNEADLISYKVKDRTEQQRRVYYFSYQFQNDIFLEENGVRLPCVLYHFERAIDLKRSRTFILGFENPNPGPWEARLVIQSDQFSSLPLKIQVSKNNIPPLTL
jgi:hypothetical protein